MRRPLCAVEGARATRCERRNKGRAQRSGCHQAAGPEGLEFIAEVKRMLDRCQWQVEDFFPSGDADSHRFAGGQEERGVKGIRVWRTK